MEIRDKQIILDLAFDHNGIFAENDTLILRQIQPSDKEDYLDMYRAKEEWQKLFARVPESAESLWEVFLDPDTLNTVIIRKADQKFCGFCGLQQYTKLAEPELSIELSKDCRHQGIGTQVLPMLMRRFSQITGTNAFISKVSKRNYASQGLMHKLGGILQVPETDTELDDKEEQAENFNVMLDYLIKHVLIFRFVV